MSVINGGYVEHNERLLRLLNVCRRAPSLARTKALHALTITLHFSLHQPVFVGNNIVHIYASQGEFSSAAKVFDKMPERNAVSFNTMIGAYSKCEDVEKAFDVFSDMRAFGYLPTQSTVAGLLSCTSLDLRAGVQLHGLSLQNGLLWADAFVGTSLLCLYGRFGLLENATRVFEAMSTKSLVTWNSMMSLLGQNGFIDESLSLFRELVRMQASLSECSLLGVLSGLSSEEDLEIGEQLHCLGVKKGLDREVSVVNSLISAYGKCCNGRAAEKIFEEAVSRDTISWNTIISITAKSENPLKALTIFASMSEQGVSANESTFVGVVNSCARVEMLKFGRTIHGMVIKKGYGTDVFVGSALIDLYVKCDNLEDSRLCFDDICEKNVVSWNSLISGYADKNSSEVCISLFLHMLRLGFRPNEFTFSSFLKTCGSPEIKQLHSVVIKTGYEENDYVLSSLISSYVKNGLISDALVLHDGSTARFFVAPSNIIAGMYNRSGLYLESLKLISMLEYPDDISWNIAIAACSRAAKHSEALELFKHKLQSRILPDNYSYASVLSTCTELCDLAVGSSIHCLIAKTGFHRADAFVCNLLINMYGKCGSIRSAVKIFDEAREKNLVTWTALISSLGIHGYAHEAFKKFGEMVSLGFKPDRVSFVSMLTVCRHSGLVKEGMDLIQRMKSDYGVEPEMEHYRCGVDLLVRNGYTKDAEKFIAEMPFPPDASVWRTFLEGCKRFIVER
ncbi:PREDICTED: pentatricopeptide repeat-containing protein At3g58590 [Tarenaya hassleriana]|uniref:pentatricopeptide repeat-containing protein At3g58590 n=1 Tax=Tarenaya hassleriana TaxID=28532 RepID=UPI00053C9075|nr:PREDICTED: pentatricopeptide repeat-containing protein At3g58590 [Tarenaya hassleriana]